MKTGKAQLLSIILIILFVTSIIATFNLVYTDFVIGDVCPKLIGIPACQIILLCFTIPFIAHIFKWKSIYYFTPLLVAFCIALYGTTMQLLGPISCPTTENNIPMCFISLGIFTTLITIKLITKSTHNEK
jgi:hypothetical protein